MKNFWYAYYVTSESGKHFASYSSISHADNALVSLTREYNAGEDGKCTITAVNFCETKKQAVELAEAWNEAFIKTETRLF